MKLSTGISPNFVAQWTVQEAIREIVQNYLDSRKEFNCGGPIKWKDGRAIIQDYGPGLELRHLALGISEKSEESIGRFGKGLKQALLVLAREERNIKIFTGGQVIIPSIEFSEEYGTEIMYITVEPAKGPAKTIRGTWVTFHCSEDELEEAKNYFVFFRKNIEKLTPQLSLPGGNVFVNGSLVGHVNGAIFSYHLDHTAAHIMSSDRDMINLNALDSVVQGVFNVCTSRKAAQMLLADVIGDSISWEATVGLRVWDMTPEQQKFWQKAFYRAAGPHAVLGDEMSREAAYRGYTPINVGWSWTGSLKALGIKTCTEALAADGTASVEVVTDLTEAEQEVLRETCRLVEENYESPGEVIVAKDLNSLLGIPESKGKAYGCHVGEEDRIYIIRDMLKMVRLALPVILHETVHKVSGFSDCTAEFEAALLEVSVNMILAR